MGLMYLASLLRQDHRKTEIFDADVEAWTLQQTVRKIMEENPPIVGFSVFQRALPSLELVVRNLREKGYTGHITCGGITPTLSHSYMSEKIGDFVDSIVLGEGENTLRQLTDRILTGQNWETLPGIAYLKRDSNIQVVNTPIDFIDLDTLPFAARDYLEFCLGKTNYATMMGSRGCYGVCTFCSNFSFENFHPGPRWRSRNPISVVDEMQDLFESRGITVFKFNDPNIFGPGNKGRDHVKHICTELIHRNLKFHLMGFCRGDDITKDPSIVNELKAAGFERLLIGVESANNEILDRFRKLETIEGMDQALAILHNAGISTVLGFMIFNPYTTIDTLKTDLAFLRRRGDVYPTLCKALRIFDGTPIQTLMEKEGRLIPKNPFEGYHDYVMPKDVAAIYALMKVLFVNCLDKIRAAGQEKIWGVKKSDSFRDRQDFNSLAEGFFTIESFLSLPPRTCVVRNLSHNERTAMGHV